MFFLESLLNNHIFIIEQFILSLGYAGVFIAAAMLAAVFLISSVMHLILHEFGHFVFGKLTNHKLISFRIFNLTFVKAPEGVKITKYGQKGSIGQCIMLPQNQDSWALCTLGGVIVNLVISLVALIVATWASNPMLVVFSYDTLISGIIIILVNLIPVFDGTNDGSSFLALLKNPLARECRYKQLRITEHLTNGKTYKAIPTDLFEVKAENKDHTNVMVCYLKIMKFYRLIDIGDLEQAGHVINELYKRLDSFRKSIRTDILLEKYYYELLVDTKEGVVDIEEIKDILNENINDANLIRVQILHSLAVGDIKKVKDLQEMIKHLADKYPYPGEIAFNLNQIHFHTRELDMQLAV